MRRVINDEDWTLFCPTVAGNLCALYGEEFDRHYAALEEQGRGTETMRARLLWVEIVTSQFETGGPSILFKDSINRELLPRGLLNPKI